MKSLRLLTMWGAVALAPFSALACGDDSPTGNGKAPSTPTNVAIAVNGTDITVTWAAVSTATSYRVVVTTPGQTDRTDTVTDAQALFTALTAGAT